MATGTTEGGVMGTRNAAKQYGMEGQLGEIHPPADDEERRARAFLARCQAEDLADMLFTPPRRTQLTKKQQRALAG